MSQLREWIAACQNPDGGFGGNKNHDSNIVCSLYGLLITRMLECSDKINCEKLLEYS